MFIQHTYTGYGRPPLGPDLPSHLQAFTPGQGGGAPAAPPAGGTSLPIADGVRVLAGPVDADPKKHTVYPYVTGSSVLGVKYADGVLLAADMLGSYGSTKRYKGVQRVKVVSPNCIVGASGEVSDFNFIITLLDELMTIDYTHDDGARLGPQQVHSYLNRVMYNRRNKFDPLWNSIVVAGVQEDGEPYLGTVNMIGVHFRDDHIATGLGSHLARPILRAEHHSDMTEEEAVQLLEKCLRILFYRDRSTLNKFQIAKVTKSGAAEVSAPFALTSEWGLKLFERKATSSDGGW
eukprot:TRINITY_DN6268_c0_g1_i1.p1 TRINITY_DN6268_c0_g1~~TRINITY_DN6268_c0_g1_i1.p1  ORF type:complete len:291 (-),score=60.05 TRINITY_DN6268_c0_g1_i1:174-1046(-)